MSERTQTEVTDLDRHDVFTYEPLRPDAFEIRLITVLPRGHDQTDIRCRLNHAVFALEELADWHEEEQRRKRVHSDNSDAVGQEEADMENRSYHTDEYRSQPAVMKSHFSRPLSYSALSYTWGLPLEQKRIYVNDRPFFIRQNLFDFLTDWSCKAQCHFEQLWIDQISINQSDVAERGHQVSHMAEIYTCAVHVYIWLGPAFPGSDELVDTLRNTPPHFDAVDRSQQQEEDEAEMWSRRLPSLRRMLLPPRYYDPAYPEGQEVKMLSLHLSAIERVLLSPYWNRLWICQEVILAANPVVLIGRREAPWIHFVGVAHSSMADGATVNFDTRPGCLRILLLNCLSREMHSNKYASLSWEQIMHLAIKSKYEEALDGVYGLQGLVAPERRIRANYSRSALDVFAEVASLLRSSQLPEVPLFISTLAQVLRLKDALSADEFKALGIIPYPE